MVSTLDERMLVAMAEAGNGTYVRANRGFVDLDPFLSTLDGLEQGQGNTVAYTDYRHQYAGFFLIGFLLLLIEGAWPTGRIRVLGMGLLLLLVGQGNATGSDGTRGNKAQAVAGSAPWPSGTLLLQTVCLPRRKDGTGLSWSWPLNGAWPRPPMGRRGRLAVVQKAAGEAVDPG